jgi:putative alpha-1,2-mannosidase
MVALLPLLQITANMLTFCKLITSVSKTIAHCNFSMGTKDGGNRFPGVVAAPFAMTKLGPDMQSGTKDAYSGYLSEGNIWGFSMMHESGTGTQLVLEHKHCVN